MKEAQPATIWLKDYKQPDYWIETTDLLFELEPDATRVTAKVRFCLNRSRHPAGATPLPPLVLDGQDLELVSLALDGTPLTGSDYSIAGDKLHLQPTAATFETEIQTRINPLANRSLEGLYCSGNLYCTQCEAEGFRRITYYLDRPDVMSIFTTRIIADSSRCPVLLSNGNMTEQKALEDGRLSVTWHDPFKKPSYLFALVAGDLACVQDSFTTMNGREVRLKIFTEAHNSTKCDHAMRSLKKAMRWDEEVYGREYDLDVFMIVAVDDFNMGAMENKGLNIFNSSCVLARPDTATDARFQVIEAIVAHEYFHNWSGNRVTCRDWFQLSLKEGLTVFRDAMFSADMNSATVKRVEDVNLLRTRQFAEDAGPMAHPVRPDNFIEISNFYTTTVYEKGAEVVRMIHNIVGREGFRKGTDLYFERHDGQAVTTEEFVRAMEDANQVDLGQFRLWYCQAGTPVISVTDSYDSESGDYSLTLRQSCPRRSGQSDPRPFHIPVAMGLLDARGGALPVTPEGATTRVLDLKEPEQTFVFTGLTDKPVPSLLRDFSAPVRLEYDYSREDLMLLMRHDEDGFIRWDSSQQLAADLILELVERLQQGKGLDMDARLVQAWGSLLEAPAGADPALVAEIFQLPSEAWLAELMDEVDVDNIHEARKFVRQQLAQALKEPLLNHVRRLSGREWSLDAVAMGERSLKNTCLSFLAALDEPLAVDLARQQYTDATNMTDGLAALRVLLHAQHDSGVSATQEVLADFAARWKDDTNVMDLWFSSQASCPRSGTLARVEALMAHPAFDGKNPNKMRALIAAFCDGNLVQFHDRSGAGYALLEREVVRADAFNPQLAARLVTPLTFWKRYDKERQQLMRATLERLQGKELSRDLFEVVNKSLAWAD